MPPAAFQVVLDIEEQFSIWPTSRRLPAHWKSVDVQGTLEDCLDYIERLWVDMRPLSLRKHMAEVRPREPEGAPSDDGIYPPVAEYLRNKRQKVSLREVCEGGCEDLKDAVSRGRLYVSLEHTLGGTDLTLTLEGSEAPVDIEALFRTGGTARWRGHVCLDSEAYIFAVEVTLPVGEAWITRIHSSL